MSVQLKGRRWTADEEARLAKAMQAGSSLAELARQLGRTLDAVTSRASGLREKQAAGFRLSSRAERKCLSCGVSFESDGPGNRICQRCKFSDARSNAIGYPDYSLRL